MATRAGVNWRRERHDEREAAFDQSFARVIVLCVGFYPILWATAFAGLFMPIVAVLSVVYLLAVRTTRIALIPLGIAGLVVLSVPIGVLAFGVDASRVLAAGYNASVWIVIAAVITVATRVDMRRPLATAFLTLIVVQAVLVIIALQIYPSRLPIPVLSSLAERLPGAFGQLGRDDMVNSSWLGRTTMRTSGIMGQAMAAGAVAALSAMMVIFVGRHSKKLQALALVAAIPVVYYSLSRATYGLIAIALLVAMIIFVYRRSTLLAYGSISISVVVLLVVALRWSDEIVAAVDEVDDLRGGSSASRGEVYSRTFDLLLAHPLPILGYGVKPQEDGLVASVGTHSTYLGLAFRGGVVAATLYLVLLLILVQRAVSTMDVVAAVATVFIAGWTFFADLDTGHLLPIMFSYAVASTVDKAPLVWPRSRRLTRTRSTGKRPAGWSRA